MNRTASFHAPGDVLLGRYQLRESIGGSDAAEVYEAIDLQADRAVAVKIARSSAVDDPNLAARFRVEAREASALEHPGIPKLYDRGEFEGRPFLVREMVWGQSLGSLIRNQEPLPVESALGITEDLLAALQHAHERGVVHGAIDPEKVIVTQGGRAKLVGFGTARASDNGTAAQVHSPSRQSYMAPEQVTGSPATEAGDLYAIGMLLYQMLTGWLPSGVETPNAQSTSQMKDRFAPPSTVRSGVPQQVDDVVAQALATHPAWRYASAAEMREDIARLATGTLADGDTEETASALLPSLRARLVAPFSERRALLRAAYVLLAGLVIIGVAVVLSATAMDEQGGSASVPGAGVSPAAAAVATTVVSTPPGPPAVAATGEPSAAPEIVAGGQPMEPPATTGVAPGDASTPGATSGPTSGDAPTGPASPAANTALSASAPQPVGIAQPDAPTSTSAPATAPERPNTAALAPAPATNTVSPPPAATAVPPAPASATPAPRGAEAPPRQSAPAISAPPVVPTARPPTAAPAAPRAVPTSPPPTPVPTRRPTAVPTAVPTSPPEPTAAPTRPRPTDVPKPPEPTDVPPTRAPTRVPQVDRATPVVPTAVPTAVPTRVPPKPTVAPPEPTDVPDTPAPTATRPRPTATQEPDPEEKPTAEPEKNDKGNKDKPAKKPKEG